MSEHELDLHGLNQMEAVQVFLDQYNRHFESNGSEPLKIIHGWGSSGNGGDKIRSAISSLLNEFPDHVSYASKLGSTIISPKDTLPTYTEYLAEKMYQFCIHPRPQSRIDHKFHAWGSKEVLNAMRMLSREGRLEKVRKNKVVVFRQAN